MKILMYTLLLWVFISFTGCTLPKPIPKFKVGDCIVGKGNEFVLTYTVVARIDGVGTEVYLVKPRWYDQDTWDMDYVNINYKKLVCPKELK